MSDEEWDSPDFNPDVSVKPTVTDKWEGEDEEDDIKDNWDEEDEDSENKGAEQKEAAPKKKKKSLKEILAEKEAKKQKEMEERRKQEEEARRKLTPEEIIAEKLRQQRLQEDSDLEMAKAAFGVSESDIGKQTLDNFEPITKDDFDKYCTMLTEKLSKLERSTNYVPFLESLYRELAVSLDVEEVKRLSSCLTAVYNEKNKQAKSAKGKKKTKGKANLNQGKDNNYDDYTTGAFDDLDDFM